MTQTSGYNGREVFIVDGLRTPFLKARGKQGPFSAADLAVQAGRQLLNRHQFDSKSIDEVVIGCVAPRENEANIARIIALRLGCGDHVPAYTVARNCASGIQALDSAAKDIADGRVDLVLAGGTEAMSHSPLIASSSYANWMAELMFSRSALDKLKTVFRFRPTMLKPIISLECGLTDPVVGLNMGQTAENLAEQFSISREQMDAYSVESHHRAAAAHAEGRFAEITPLIDSKGKVYDKDDGVRADSSEEKLATLKPYFDKRYGAITPANSSQITDGAAMLLLASADAVKKYNLPVLARIVDCNWAALGPEVMGLGPVCASRPLLERQKLKTSDIDYWEINEAFAAQVLACQAAWQDSDFCAEHFSGRKAFTAIPDDRLNIDGGAVAMGHPVGASGARIVLHLLHTLTENKAKRGIASACIGGGQGGAMLIELSEGE